MANETDKILKPNVSETTYLNMAAQLVEFMEFSVYPEQDVEDGKALLVALEMLAVQHGFTNDGEMEELVVNINCAAEANKLSGWQSVKPLLPYERCVYSC